MKKRCRAAQGCPIMFEGEGNYCPKHKATAEKKYQLYSALYDKKRLQREPEVRRFYNSKEWKNFRAEVLALYPFCQHCGKTYSNEVHHVIPLKADWSKRLDKGNVKAWCKPCHSRYEKSKH